MNILTELLIESIRVILKTEAVTEEKNKAVTATFPNPSGGPALKLIDNPGEDYAVILNKTTRYYPREPFSLEQIRKSVSDYASGSTVLLDYTYNDGTESRTDRIAKAAEAENQTLAGLIDLCIRIQLLQSSEIKNLLAAGGTVNVHFWNRAKDFRYRQLGSDLKKI